MSTNLPSHSSAQINTQLDDLFIQARYSASYAAEVALTLDPMLDLWVSNTPGPLSPGLVLSLVLNTANAATSTKGFFKKTMPQEWNRILQEEDPRILQVVENAIANKDYKDIYSLKICHVVVPPDIPRWQIIGTGVNATLNSWKEEYVGSAADTLFHTIQKHAANKKEMYAPYLSIVQSSGMGKSRMVDELSKRILVIPVNLRDGGTGFPASDIAVVRFLTTYSATTAFRRAEAFLIALFKTTEEYLRDIDTYIRDLEGISPRSNTTAQKFRVLMTTGQSFGKQGNLRVGFFDKVIAYAESLVHGPGSSNEYDKEINFGDVNDESKMNTVAIAAGGLCDSYQEDTALIDRVVLAFDEAHVLHTREHNDAPTRFFQFRRALRNARYSPVFSLFLSTNIGVHDFTPRRPPPNDNSTGRVGVEELKICSPFTELGFDQMMKHINLEDKTIQEVSAPTFMANFGRPLFGSRLKHGDRDDKNAIITYAASKLLGGSSDLCNLNQGGKLACMVIRLGLEFDSTTEVAREREREQVEAHMRVCLTVHRGFETMVTASPSEPLLAEAARFLIKKSGLDLPSSLLVELKGPSIKKGYRGELIVVLLMTMAVDVVSELPPTSPTLRTTRPAALAPKDAVDEPRARPLLQLLRILLAAKWLEALEASKPTKSRTKAEGQCTFASTFSKSTIYFTHFIKIHDPCVVNRKFLWMLMARGAAVLCPDGFRGADIIIPFLFFSQLLNHLDVSAIFVQVKNDRTFGEHPNLFLFNAMNPYFLGFFDTEDAPLEGSRATGELAPPPIIRIVFVLSSNVSNVVVIPPEPRHPKRQAKTDAHKKIHRKSPAYTSFDIWCSNASSETFGVIKQGDDDIFQQLLMVLSVFSDTYIYENVIDSAEALRRQMNPGTMSDPNHWRFSSGKLPQPAPAIDCDYNSEEAQESDEVE